MAVKGQSATGTVGAQDETAKRHLDRYGELKKFRDPWMPYWKEASRLVLPPEYFDPTVHTMGGPDMSVYADLYDSTASQANLILANGQFSHITPNNEQFFNLSPQPGFAAEDENAKEWLHNASDTLFSIIQTSLFPASMYSVDLQRGAFSTALMYCAEGRRKPLHFRSEAIGSYCLAEDDERYVDTVYREYVLTTRNAVALFGKENLSPDIQKSIDSEQDSELDKEWSFLQCVYPRPDNERDPSLNNGPNKPWASVHVEVDSKMTVKEDGFDENPYTASRFQMHSHSPYGIGPSAFVLPEARQLNYLELSLDAAQEKIAFPPILAPQEMKGRLDQRSRAVTWLPSQLLQNNSIPRAWANEGNPQFGIERSQRKQENIEALFYNDVFKLFTQMDVKGVTARAIAEQANEKLGRFQPVFSLMSVETLEPIITRAFAICLRAGHFGDPRDIPPSLLVENQDGVFLQDLNINFSSRMALAIRARHNAALLSTMEALFPLFNAIGPAAFDHLNLREVLREYPRNEGVPAKWLEDLDTVVSKEAARAQAEADRAALEQAQVAGDVAGKLKGADPDNLRDLAGLAA